jgi:hypothetical protein
MNNELKRQKIKEMKELDNFCLEMVLQCLNLNEFVWDNIEFDWDNDEVNRLFLNKLWAMKLDLIAHLKHCKTCKFMAETSVPIKCQNPISSTENEA